jgi:hypothetical protein
MGSDHVEERPATSHPPGRRSAFPLCKHPRIFPLTVHPAGHYLGTLDIRFHKHDNMNVIKKKIGIRIVIVE